MKLTTKQQYDATKHTRTLLEDARQQLDLELASLDNQITTLTAEIADYEQEHGDA